MNIRKTLYTAIIAICFLGINFNGLSQNQDQKSKSKNTKASADDHDYIEYGGGSGSGRSGGMAVADDEAESFDALGSLHSLVHTNSMRLMNIDLTGHVDRDFPKVMTEHHKNAVEMAELYLSAGINTQLRELAEKIIVTNQRQIEKLMPFVIENNSVVGADTSVVLLEPLQNMIDNTAELSPENLDKDFAAMMVEHHKSGIEIAEVQLQGGAHNELQALATEIIEEHNKEVGELSAWQRKNRK